MSEITVKGADKVIRKLNSLGDPAIMRRAMNRSVQHIHRRIAKYPPQRPTTYIRTGKQGRGWQDKVLENGRKGEVKNIQTDRAFWVQGPGQTWFHELTGWLTTEDIAKSEAKAVREIFEDEYRKAMK